MKKIISLLMAVLLLAIALSACSDGGGDSVLDSAVFGTVETSRWFSKINYYDSSCTLLKSKRTIFPSIGNTSYSSVHSGDKVFTVSGIGEFFASDNMIMLDVKENTVKKLQTSVSAIYDMHAQGNGVFLISGLTSNLVRFDLQTREEIEFEPKNSDGAFVYAYEDTVYFVSNNLGESFLYLLDEKTLTVKKMYNVTEYFYSVNDMLAVGNKLYIVSFTTLGEEDREEFAGNLVCFDLERETFEKVNLQSNQPCYDMAFYKEKLIILNRALYNPSEQDLTILDLNTNEIQTKGFSLPIKQIEVAEDRLYCLLDSDATLSDNTTMFVYDLTDPELPVTIKANLSTGDNYTISSFFIL